MGGNTPTDVDTVRFDTTELAEVSAAADPEIEAAARAIAAARASADGTARLSNEPPKSSRTATVHDPLTTALLAAASRDIE
jgi:hypothetical protein